MGEKKRRLLHAIINGEPRPKIMRLYNMTDKELDGFIERNGKAITFGKLKKA